MCFASHRQLAEFWVPYLLVMAMHVLSISINDSIATNHESFSTVRVVASGFHLLNMFGNGILKIGRVGVCPCISFGLTNAFAHSK